MPMKKSIDHISHARLLEELRIKNSAIDSAVNGIAFGDLEGRVTYGNAAAIALTGYTLEEVLGWSVLTFADNQEEAALIFAEVLEKGSWIGEVAGRKKDGSLLVVHLSASLVRSEDGEPVCTLCSFVDITRARQAFDELHIKSSAIDSAVNGIAFGDIEGRVTYANAAAIALTGYTLEEVLGWSVLAFADNQEEAALIFAEFLEKGSWIGEVAGRKKDGSRMVAHLSASLVRDDNDKPIGTLCSFVDITRSRQAFEELRLKDYAIASSINGIVFGDLEGRVTYGNAAAIDLIGYTLEEVFGWSMLTFADNQEEAALIFAEVLEKGSWIGEVAGRKKDGSRIVVHLSASLVRGENGEPVYTLCSFVDVTEKNRAQEDLRKTLDELEQRVAGRTIDLTGANEKLRREIEERKLAERNLRQKERELQLNALHLEETNIAMKVLLEQREKDKNELEEKVLTNVRGLLLPCLERLQGCRLNDRQKVYADILETNLQAIISPFLHRLSSRSLNLTPAEIQVAGLVKDGKSSKEIASLMNVSERGVEFHRNNIRRKLGLNNAKKNLRSYLLSLS